MEEGGELATTATPPQPRASPRAAAAPRRWDDVPDNILVRVSAFLPCRADRAHMACANPQWSAAVRGKGRPAPPVLPPLPPLPPQLPWLIFPSTEAPTFYSPVGRRYHRLGPLPPDVRAARFCGSTGGGWLILALDSRHAYALYNLNSGERIPLPPGFRTPTNAAFPLVVRAAALSGAPSPNAPFMVAAILQAASGPTAAFWAPGNDAWYSPGGLRAMSPQDVIFHQGGIFFLGADESVVVFVPFRGPEGDVVFSRVDFDMPQREDYAQDLYFMHGHGTMTRYLVESQGRLLMVVRYAYADAGTLTFRVFGFLITAPMTEAERPRAIWENIGDGLDGRMLLLGRGCSRSFDVAHYDGFDESMVYFLDERMASEQLADGRRGYSFTDMGRFNMGVLSTTPWPEDHPQGSDNAPPTWWLH